MAFKWKAEEGWRDRNQEEGLVEQQRSRLKETERLLIMVEDKTGKVVCVCVCVCELVLMTLCLVSRCT